MTTHPDMAAEQAYIDRARHELRRSMAAIQRSLDRAREDRQNPDSAALAANLAARMYRLESADSYASCFARLDDEDGERLYIGRQHIADADQNPLVIDWRTPRAAAFYRATPLDPMGVLLRRQFLLEAQELVEIYDTDLSDPQAAVGVPDPLLAEINRARTGRMREVVATIQVEQDEIVRAAGDQPLFVQGGPGTGKTVVGLHRAAYLLYEHRDVLSKDGVLVLGPNERFIEYISDVLPQLGERTVRQLTLARLLDSQRRQGPSVEPREVDRLRTDARMAELVRAALATRAVPPDEDIRVRTRHGGATVPAHTARDLMSDALDQEATIGQARQVWIANVIRAAFRGLANRSQTSVSEFASEARRDERLREYLDHHWRATSESQAFALVWRTIADEPAVATGIGFTADEVALLAAHRRSRPADTVDMVLADEIRAALGKRPPTNGHVVVDEAQDLSPLELRAVGRRVEKGSITVLGDLAQSTGLHRYRSWDEVARFMAIDDHQPAISQLSVGYRVPAEFVEIANRLLPMMDVELPPTGSIRSAGRPVRVDQTAAADVVGRVVEAANRYAEAGATVAVIGGDDVATRLDGLRPEVPTLTPAAAKGLEFEAVVVAEPAIILAEETRGPSLLFVALTRALHELHLIGSRPLPAHLLAVEEGAAPVPDGRL